MQSRLQQRTDVVRISTKWMQQKAHCHQLLRILAWLRHQLRARQRLHLKSRLCKPKGSLSKQKQRMSTGATKVCSKTSILTRNSALIICQFCVIDNLLAVIS